MISWRIPFLGPNLAGNPTIPGGTVPCLGRRNPPYADFIILRIQLRFPGDRGVIDHTVAEAKRTSDPLRALLEQLGNALEHANTEFKRCWAIMIHGYTFKFYDYHGNLPAHARLIPWGPPNQAQQNSFHACVDSLAIDWTLRHMAQNDTPPAR